MSDSNTHAKAAGHGVPAQRMPEKAIKDDITDVDPHNALTDIEGGPSALISNIKVHSTLPLPQTLHGLVRAVHPLRPAFVGRALRTDVRAGA
jgi:hypothetical protein